MLTAEQKKKVLSAMENHMSPDQYGRVTIRNVYFDTDNYRLIRRSIEKPAYKEKLRIRSYCHADPDSDVFVELKKKYKTSCTKDGFPCRKKQPCAGYAANICTACITRYQRKSIISSHITRIFSLRHLSLMKEKRFAPKINPIFASPLTIIFSRGKKICPWKVKYTACLCCLRGRL